MTCKEAVEQMNLGKSVSWNSWLRLQLHLSLCRACRYYLKTNRMLKLAMQKMLLRHVGAQPVEELKQELLKKHARAPVA